MKIYYFIFGACILMNNSFENFSLTQKYLIKAAHGRYLQKPMLAEFIKDFECYLDYLEVVGK